MSYILEAIRRSEEARHKRLMPAVSTIHATQPAGARGVPRTLQAGFAMLLAAAFMAAAIFALGFWLRQAQDAGPLAPLAPAPPPTAAPASPDPRMQTAAEPAAPPPADATPPAEAGNPAAAPAAQTNAAAPAEPAPSVPVGVRPAAAPGATGEAKAEDRRPRRPYSSPAEGEPAKAKREPKSQAARPTAPGAAPVEAPPAAPQPPAPELVTATALRDLEPSVQRTLPSIAITLHRYAPAPEARMIRVNGRVAREGDVVAGDLAVAEITRNGVVFVIGDHRFYMDAFQTWQARGGS